MSLSGWNDSTKAQSLRVAKRCTVDQGEWGTVRAASEDRPVPVSKFSLLWEPGRSVCFKSASNLWSFDMTIQQVEDSEDAAIRHSLS